MPSTGDIRDMFDRILLGQQISAEDPAFKDYAGCDTELSRTLAQINVFIKHKFLDEKDPAIKLLTDLLKEEIKAVMASSDKMDNLTKNAYRQPKSREGADMSGKD